MNLSINPFMNKSSVNAVSAINARSISGDPSGGSSGAYNRMGSNRNSKTAGLGPDVGTAYAGVYNGKENITGGKFYAYG